MKAWAKQALCGSIVLAIAAARASTVTYYHNDLAGSAAAATDAGGTVLWRETYRPYGERVTKSAAASDNKVWFANRMEDAETGLLYMHARYYDPVTGVFRSPDPVLFRADNIHSFNRYAYANNNPLRYIDPNGRDALIIPTGPHSFRIEIPITFSGPGMTQTVINQITAQIESRWSGQFGDLQITTRVVDGNLNYVQLIETKTELPSGQSYVMGGNQGKWNVNEDLFRTDVAAHEAGHLMGIGDHYYWFAPMLFPESEPDYEFSNMGARIDQPATAFTLGEIFSSPRNTLMPSEDEEGAGGDSD